MNGKLVKNKRYLLKWSFVLSFFIYLSITNVIYHSRYPQLTQTNPLITLRLFASMAFSDALLRQLTLIEFS